MKILPFIMTLFIWTCAHAGKGTNDLLLDVTVALRGVSLSQHQEGLLNSAVAITQKLPEFSADTKKSFKQSIGTALERPDNSFPEISRVIVSHYEGRLQETVNSHYEIASAWARFDTSLDEKQRQHFREKMAPTIKAAFQGMTQNSTRLAKIENLASADNAKKLGLSDDQEGAAKKIYEEAFAKVSALESLGQEANDKIAKALTEPSRDFLEIPQAMLSYFKALSAALRVRYEYGLAVHKILNPEQQQVLDQMVRSKLKLLSLVLI